MNFLADENIDKEIVDVLRNDGYNVEYVIEMSPSIDDRMVLKHANIKRSILITSDKDFGELVFRQNLISEGIILIRLHGINSNKKAEVVLNFIKEYEDKIQDSFSVISKTNIRIRSKIN